MVLQQLPMIGLFAIVIVLGRALYSLFKWHRPMVMALKYLLKASFFLRGIHFSLDIPNQRTLESMTGLHLCNDGHRLYWLLFAILPYDHLLVPVDHFFKSKLFRNTLFLLGFFPQEYGMTPENLEDFDSRLVPYLAQDFSVWQPVFFEFRDQQPIPYALILGLKVKRSVNIWKWYRTGKIKKVIKSFTQHI